MQEEPRDHRTPRKRLCWSYRAFALSSDAVRLLDCRWSGHPRRATLRCCNRRDPAACRGSRRQAAIVAASCSASGMSIASAEIRDDCKLGADRQAAKEPRVQLRCRYTAALSGNTPRAPSLTGIAGSRAPARAGARAAKCDERVKRRARGGRSGAARRLLSVDDEPTARTFPSPRRRVRDARCAGDKRRKGCARGRAVGTS